MLVALVAVAAGSGARAQAPGVTLRLASVTQWILDQHAAAGAELRRALDQGVQGWTVFWWQRGRIHREALASKGVRLVDGEEGRALGARGDVGLVGIQWPRGTSAWTEVTLTAGAPDALAVLEVGGERHTIRQVLETLLAIQPDGTIVPVPLSPRALVPGPGVPVGRYPFGMVVPGDVPFGALPGGLQATVARSQVEAVTNGAVTPGGLADASPHPGSGLGDWREADRVLVRVPVPGGGPPPALVLGWKDRVLRPDPDAEFPLRAVAPSPIRRF